ncbi:MAG: dihydrofolate reductase family protein [Arhodomonas sp.]|nr:dihydrofolate reductase family protein [Arhodomonas sp.]
MPRVVKSRRQAPGPFDEAKLRAGTAAGTGKTARCPRDEPWRRRITQHHANVCSAIGEREVPARAVSATWSWRSCSELDEVAYVRFASVYRSFQDIQRLPVPRLERLEQGPGRPEGRRRMTTPMGFLRRRRCRHDGPGACGWHGGASIPRDPNPRVGSRTGARRRRGRRGLAPARRRTPCRGHAMAAAGERARGATAYVTPGTLFPYQGAPAPAPRRWSDAGVGAGGRWPRQDPDPRVAGSGAAPLREAGVGGAATGLLESEARALNPGFIRRMESGLPWVRLKLAASLDGRTAMASGESQWITGRQARDGAVRCRAVAAAVVTGSGTVLRSSPPTVRPQSWQHGGRCEHGAPAVARGAWTAAAQPAALRRYSRRRQR